MKTNKKNKKTESPAELRAGLYRYKGRIYSIFNRDTWKKIPSDIRDAYEEDFKEKVETKKIKLPKPKKVVADVTTFTRTEKDEKTGKRSKKLVKIFRYKFEDGKPAKESDFNKYTFSLPKNTREPLIDYRVINNSVLTQIEKSLSEGQAVTINIKGKRTRVTLKNILQVREKIKRLLKKEKKEQGVTGKSKDNYVLAFFNVKEYDGKTVIDFHGMQSDNYEDYTDEMEQ